MAKRGKAKRRKKKPPAADAKPPAEAVACTWEGAPVHREEGREYYAAFLTPERRFAVGDYVLVQPCEGTGNRRPYVARCLALWDEGGVMSFRAQWFFRPLDIPAGSKPSDTYTAVLGKGPPRQNDVYGSTLCDDNSIHSIIDKCQVLPFLYRGSPKYGPFVCRFAYKSEGNRLLTMREADPEIQTITASFMLNGSAVVAAAAAAAAATAATATAAAATTAAIATTAIATRTAAAPASSEDDPPRHLYCASLLRAQRCFDERGDWRLAWTDEADDKLAELLRRFHFDFASAADALATWVRIERKWAVRVGLLSARECRLRWVELDRHLAAHCEGASCTWAS